MTSSAGVWGKKRLLTPFSAPRSGIPGALEANDSLNFSTPMTVQEMMTIIAALAVLAAPVEAAPLLEGGTNEAPVSLAGDSVDAFEIVDGAAAIMGGLSGIYLATDRLFLEGQRAGVVHDVGYDILWFSVALGGLVNVIAGIVDIIFGVTADPESERYAGWETGAIRSSAQARVSKELWSRVFNGVAGALYAAGGVTSWVLLAVEPDAGYIAPLAVGWTIAAGLALSSLFVDSSADTTLDTLDGATPTVTAAPIVLDGGGGISVVATW